MPTTTTTTTAVGTTTVRLLVHCPKQTQDRVDASGSSRSGVSIPGSMQQTGRPFASQISGPPLLGHRPQICPQSPDLDQEPSIPALLLYYSCSPPGTEQRAGVMQRRARVRIVRIGPHSPPSYCSSSPPCLRHTQTQTPACCRAGKEPAEGMDGSIDAVRISGGGPSLVGLAESSQVRLARPSPSLPRVRRRSTGTHDSRAAPPPRGSSPTTTTTPNYYCRC